MCRDGDKGTRAHYSPLSMCSVSFRGCFMDKVFGQSIVYTWDRDSCKLNKLNFSEGSRSPPPRLPRSTYDIPQGGWRLSKQCLHCTMGPITLQFTSKDSALCPCYHPSGTCHSHRGHGCGMESHFCLLLTLICSNRCSMDVYMVQTKKQTNYVNL